MRRAKVVATVLVLTLGCPGNFPTSAPAAETAVQRGSDPFIPGFRHFTVIAPYLDTPVGPGQGKPLGGFSVFGYYPDLLQGRLKILGEWSDTFLDLNLSTPLGILGARPGGPNPLEVGAGFTGEFLSAENTLYAYGQGRRLRTFEFFSSTYAGKAFVRLAPTETEDAKVTYLYRVYEFGRRNGKALFVPEDVAVHVARWDLNSVRKTLTVPEAEELAGREYNVYVEGHLRDDVEPDRTGLRLAAVQSRTLVRSGMSLQNFFTLDAAARHRLNLGLRGGIGSRQDYLSLFRLGSFQDGNGNTGLPGYFFSEVRAKAFVLADSLYTYRPNPRWKLQFEVHYGAARQLDLPAPRFKTHQLLGLGVGVEVKILRLPIAVTYGFAPLAPRGTLRSTPHGGHEVLVATFLAF